MAASATGYRQSRFLGLSNGYRLRAQAAYDTEVAERKVGSKLAKIRTWAEVTGQQNVRGDA
jgi:antitoxin HigA-1